MDINIILDNIYDLALDNPITGHFETPSKGQLKTNSANQGMFKEL